MSDALVLEFVLLVAFYFKYFSNVLFISYHHDSSDKLEYQRMAAELQKRLPEYTVNCGYITPPDVFLMVVILALQFFFKGLYKLFMKITAMGTPGKFIIGLLCCLPFGCLLEPKNAFRISFEGHTLYLDESSDLENINVDNLVDIIKKNVGFTFPRGVVLGSMLWALRDFESQNRRR